nr:hypothetical protein [Tanacetum cinerariifolium]
MELFSLIRAPNPTKVKTGSRPRAPHEVPLLTLTATRVIKMDEPAVATDSSSVPSTIERSPLDFAHESEASGKETAAPEMPPPEDVPPTTAPGADQAGEVVATEPPAARESRKRGHDGINANAPLKSLRRDHADLRPSGSSRGGKSLAAMQFCLASNVFMSKGVPADVSDLDPLAFANAPSPHPTDVAQSSQSVAAVGDSESKNVSSPAKVGSSGSVQAGGQAAAKIRCSGGSQRSKNPSPRVKKKNLEVLLETEVDALQQQAFADVLSAGVTKGMNEGLKHGVEHWHAQLTVESLEAYDPEVEANFTVALQSLKDLRYRLLDQLEGLKDASMDVIMAALYLESDTGGMLHPLYVTSVPAPLSSPSLVGSPHHARSDGVPVSVPTVVPQGLALLLVDAATQTDLEDA